MDNKGDLLAGVIFGTVIGYGAGMILAPASGEETRRRIWEKTESMTSQAEEKGEELAEKFSEGARDVISEIREQVSAGISLEDALREIEEKLET